METSLGPTLAEFMYGPESVHIYARILGPYINYMRELDPAFLSRRPKSRGALFAVSALTRTGVVGEGADDLILEVLQEMSPDRALELELGRGGVHCAGKSVAVLTGNRLRAPGSKFLLVCYSRKSSVKILCLCLCALSIRPPKRGSKIINFYVCVCFSCSLIECIEADPDFRDSRGKSAQTPACGG